LLLIDDALVASYGWCKFKDELISMGRAAAGYAFGSCFVQAGGLSFLLAW
jgi:hypothetical protein